MIFKSVRELSNHTSAILKLATQAEPVVITSYGKVKALISPLRGEDIDIALLRHPKVVEKLKEAERSIYTDGGTDVQELAKKILGRNPAALKEELDKFYGDLTKLITGEDSEDQKADNIKTSRR